MLTRYHISFAMTYQSLFLLYVILLAVGRNEDLASDAKEMMMIVVMKLRNHMKILLKRLNPVPSVQGSCYPLRHQEA